jgi:hypothetical protein
MIQVFVALRQHPMASNFKNGGAELLNILSTLLDDRRYLELSKSRFSTELKFY